jgi:DNA-binding MarR family transcriptional regulator
MKLKRGTVLLGVAGALGAWFVAGGKAVIQQVINDHWETVGPMVYGTWDWLVGVYEWVVHPVSIALWVAVLVPVAFVAVIIALVVYANKLYSDLEVATEKLNPSLPPLSESAHKVMAAIVQHSGQLDGLSLSDLPRATGLSQLVLEGAVDDLMAWNLIYVSHGRWGTPVSLTPAGRQYILAPGSPLAALVK